MAEHATVRTLWNHAIHWKPGFFETCKVLLRGSGPAFGELGAAWFRGELDTDDEALVDLALKIDDRVGVGHFLLLGDQIGVHLHLTEGLLELFERDSRVGLGVRDDGLVVVSLETCLLGCIDGHLPP